MTNKLLDKILHRKIIKNLNKALNVLNEVKFNWSITFLCRFCLTKFTTEYTNRFYCINCNTLLKDVDMINFKIKEVNSELPYLDGIGYSWNS